MPEWHWPGHQAFGEAVGYADTNNPSAGIVVCDRGLRGKLEATGARVGDASVKRWDGRVNLEWIQKLEHTNNCF